MTKSWTRKDFRIDWFSGSGAGGQHRNKHQNCVRITHIESGISATCQEFRERKRNFEKAFKALANRLVAAYNADVGRERFISETVRRTYNLCDNRVTDHRTGKLTSWDAFDLDEVIRNALAMENDDDESDTRDET